MRDRSYARGQEWTCNVCDGGPGNNCACICDLPRRVTPGPITEMMPRPYAFQRKPASTTRLLLWVFVGNGLFYIACGYLALRIFL